MALTSLLDEALEAWEYTRNGLIAEVKNLSDSDLLFRPNPESRTAAELARHVIESGRMMAGELTRPDGNFRRKPYPALMKAYNRGVPRARTKAQLIALLKRTHAEGDRKIRAAGELMMLQAITRFDGIEGTRLAWMHHAISHEEYHRGQLALYARLVGRVPALTQLIYGKE
jgi:uncharacterized damage-inducible protein DinB